MLSERGGRGPVVQPAGGVPGDPAGAGEAGGQEGGREGGHHAQEREVTGETIHRWTLLHKVHNLKTRHYRNFKAISTRQFFGLVYHA